MIGVQNGYLMKKQKNDFFMIPSTLVQSLWTFGTSKLERSSSSTLTRTCNSKKIEFECMAAHNPKINIWAGISRNGPTKLIIFKGNLNGPGYKLKFCVMARMSRIV